MTVYRYASIAVLALVGAMTHANWTAMTIGVTGGRSMTTYNGALYVAVYNDGIRKTANDGANWTTANVGLPLTGGQIKVQSVGRSATALFCGTESGVYRSTDNGASWVIANSLLPAGSATVYANKFYTFEGVTIAVFSGPISGNGGGVFRTTDNGTTWLSGFSGLSSNMTVYGLDYVDGVLYAATNTRLMKSTNLGGSWEEASPSEAYGFYAIQGYGGRLVALTALGTKYSLNGGQTWTNSTNYPLANSGPGAELISYDGKYYAITKSASVGCYRSLDGGATWEVFNTGLSAVNTFTDSQEEFHASGNKLYIACRFESYSAPGSTVGLQDPIADELPLPFPTIFTDHFSIDLTGLNAGATVLLIDASGREAARHGNLPATPVRIERKGLAAGRYQCMLLDARTGGLRSLGPVIAD